MRIVGDDGKNLPVVQNCDIIKQYCEFMDIDSRYKSELKDLPTTEEQKGCYERALHEAISKGILTDYLTRKGVAVINMLTDEYDYELDMQTKAEEACQEKAEESASKMLIKKYPLADITDITGLPLEQVLELQKKIMVEA